MKKQMLQVQQFIFMIAIANNTGEIEANIMNGNWS